LRLKARDRASRLGGAGGVGEIGELGVGFEAVLVGVGLVEAVGEIWRDCGGGSEGYECGGDGESAELHGDGWEMRLSALERVGIAKGVKEEVDVRMIE
jgi:hypothetical protein